MTVVLGGAAGLVAARTGRAFFAFVLLLFAAYPTIFGWYVFFSLPLLLVLAIGGAARFFGGPRTAEPRPSA